MRVHSVVISFALVLAIAPTFSLVENEAHAEEAAVDPRAEELLNKFMGALQDNSGDMNAAAVAAKPFLHKSLYSKDGTSLSPDLMRFSFKKAWEGSKFYSVPVKITRIRPTNVSAIGFRETAEAGKVVDYFIAKRPGIAGLPAPVKVFFPAGGGEPKISYIGSI